MSRRTPNPESVKQQVERRRMEQDKTILEWLRSHGQAVQSREISHATGIGWASTIARLTVLTNLRVVRRAYVGKDRGGKDIVTFQAATAEVIAQPRREVPFQPMRPMRPTVIPVRARGRIALSSHNEAPVSFGRGRE